jgi:hypothetical protein
VDDVRNGAKEDSSNTNNTGNMNRAKEATVKARESLKENTRPGKPAKNTKGTSIINVRLPDKQYHDLVLLSSYNKILRKRPDTASGIITAALRLYLDALKFELDPKQIRNKPPVEYIDRLQKLHSELGTNRGIPKSFSLPKEAVEEMTTISAFNKYHDLSPDGSVEIIYDALCLYFDSISEDFRPEAE